MNHNYKSGGALPLIIGGSVAIYGAASVLSSFGNNPAIINTSHGNGVNAIVSVIALVLGIVVVRKRDGFSAIMLGVAVAAVIGYGDYKVDSQRVINLAVSAGSAVAAGAGTAVNSVSHNVSGQSNVKPSSGLKGGYRWLVEAERDWCVKTKNTTSLACKTHQCSINGNNGNKGCGPTPKPTK